MEEEWGEGWMGQNDDRRGGERSQSKVPGYKINIGSGDERDIWRERESKKRRMRENKGEKRRECKGMKEGLQRIDNPARVGIAVVNRTSSALKEIGRG